MISKRALIIGSISGLALASLAFFHWESGEGWPTAETPLEEEVVNADGGESLPLEVDEGVEEPSPIQPQTNAYPEVTPEDCQNECRAFQGKPEDQAYCRSVCGYSQEEGVAPPQAGDCDQKEGLERDRCIKDEAVRDQDIGRCEEIRDDQMKRSCQHRVTEDYFP